MKKYDVASTHDAMALAVCRQKWKGSLEKHPTPLTTAWREAWEHADVRKAARISGEDDESLSWPHAMGILYPDEITAFVDIGERRLRAVLRLMSPASGRVFYQAVVALAVLLERK